MKDYKITRYKDVAGNDRIEVYRITGSKKLSFSGYDIDFTEIMFSGNSRDIYFEKKGE